MRPPVPSALSLSHWAFLAALLLVCVSAQSSSPPITSPPPSSTSSVSYSQSTSFSTFTTTSHSGSQNVPITTSTPVIIEIPITPSPTSSAPANASTSTSPQPITLDTKIDGAFGVLGAVLILTGIPSAFLGHKNRWSSFFIIGFYTLSLVCFVLILKYGILQAVNPPDATLRGLFVLSCGVAGIAGGGIAIFFWKASKYFIGGWGGFALALWIQCFRNGGLIGPIGLRWIMYIVLGAFGFILCTIPKIHYHVLLVSTACVGASAFMLGVDCYTTVGLKEFYMWNLGFKSLFPKYTNNGIRFPVTQTMQIEIGLLGAVALMGMAVQFRILQVLQRKLKEIKEEQRIQDEAAVARAAERAATLEQEKAEWEREHSGTLFKHGRLDSETSSSMLLKGDDGFGTLSPGERRSSTFTLVGVPGDARLRNQSGLSEFVAAPTPEEEMKRANRYPQRPGVLPAMDLGLDIEKDVPPDYLTDDPKELSPKPTSGVSAADLEDLKRKQELLAEIQTIRRSIDVLKSETPSSSSDSRRQSLSSRRPLSQDFSSLVPIVPGPSHIRPPRQKDPRARVQSMELWNMSSSRDAPTPVSRRNSTPLQDEDWDAYVQDRKLLQPPSGVTPPIPTTPISPVPRAVLSPAVAEALLQRQRRESSLSFNQLGRLTPETPRDSSSGPKDSSSDDIPLALRPHKKAASSGGHIPVTILPPKKPSAPRSPGPTTRVHTFEELAERHREKIRELQMPLTRAETEQADIKAARQRWEKARAVEKQAVNKRQTEKAAQYTKDAAKRHVSGDMDITNRPKKHGRSLSADILGADGTRSSRRMSTMKVEDWQRGQQDLEMGLRPPASQVPFPESQATQAPTRERRSSHRLSTLISRDPPS